MTRTGCDRFVTEACAKAYALLSQPAADAAEQQAAIERLRADVAENRKTQKFIDENAQTTEIA